MYKSKIPSRVLAAEFDWEDSGKDTDMPKLPNKGLLTKLSHVRENDFTFCPKVSYPSY